MKPKPIRHILPPEGIRAGESIERQHAEGVQRLKDEIHKRESFVAPDGSADVTDAEQQMGRCLMREVVVAKLQKLNPNLMYERSKNWPEFGGMYIQDYSIDDLTLNMVGKKHLCWFPHTAIAEFDIRLVVNERVPDPTVPMHWLEAPKLEGHIPGWRSTIVKLVKGERQPGMCPSS